MTLILVSPAADYHLLSDEERRLAVGLPADDTSQDATLAMLGLEAAEWVATICGVPAADGSMLEPPVVCVPTFRPEVVQEVRSVVSMPRAVSLARRFVYGVSGTLNGVDLTSDEFRVNGEAGMLERVVAAHYPAYWGSGTLVATYTAGFAEVPPALKGVASDYLAHLYTQADRDIAVRSETVVDIETVTYRPGDEIATSIAEIARQRLTRYRTDLYG